MKGPKYFGCHVSCAGGLECALENGMQLGVNAIQLHASPPQRWNSKPSKPNYEEKFLELKPKSGVERVFFHAIYLINLASMNPQQLGLSKLSLINALDLMARIKGDGVVFHVGSMKEHAEEHTAFKQIAATINQILEASPKTARLILEVAAGSGSVVGDRFEELAEIYELIDDQDRVGFGLDTQHMWASGYNLQEDLEKIIQDVDRIFSMEKVWLIHLNDSKTELASRKDRHENIGDGLIGNEALKAFFTHKKLQKIPFILETPGMKAIETAKVEVEKLRSWVTG